MAKEKFKFIVSVTLRNKNDVLIVNKKVSVIRVDQYTALNYVKTKYPWPHFCELESTEPLKIENHDNTF